MPDQTNYTAMKYAKLELELKSCQYCGRDCELKYV